jgi:type II secretory pathway component PulF
MLLSIAADERAELHFADLASALDAGLPIAALGGDPAAGDRALHAAMARRGVRLLPTEDVVLLHGWRAGKGGAALRACAAARNQRVAFARLLWSGLRYPLLLAALLLAASVATASFLGPWPAACLASGYAGLAALVLAARRALRAGAEWPRRLPGASALLDAAAEIPYLESLHALYGAGVPLLAAHAAAVAAAPAGQQAQRLQIADRVLQQGRPLHEALATAMALHQETRALLHTGELAGQLEDALGRALQRRRETFGRALARLARGIGQAAYALAVVGVLWMVVAFYGAYFAQMRGLLQSR